MGVVSVLGVVSVKFLHKCLVHNTPFAYLSTHVRTSNVKWSHSDSMAHSQIRLHMPNQAMKDGVIEHHVCKSIHKCPDAAFKLKSQKALSANAFANVRMPPGLNA